MLLSKKQSVAKKKVGEPKISPFIQGLEMKTRSNGKGKAPKKEDRPLSHPRTRASLNTAEKRDSFSCYKPLPAIGSNDEKERAIKSSPPKTSGKRSLPKSTEKVYPHNSNNTERDESLSDTIKRMRLGMDFSSSSLSNCLQDSMQVEANEQVLMNSNHVEGIDSEPNEIQLVIRLPKGTRVQQTFLNTDTLQTVLKWLSKQMKVTITLTRYVLYLNEVPKKELTQQKLTLLKLGIKDRSVLTLDTRD